MNRFDLLNKIQSILKDNLVICNIGLPSQELYKINDQPNFFNCVVFANTILSELDVLKSLHEIEYKLQT